MERKSPGETQQQHALVRDEFKKQAAGWGKRSDDLSEAAQSLGLEAGFTVLDVAAGSALFASAIAPHVKQVIACDITPEMLAQARQRGIDNLKTMIAAAEALPHAKGTFDRVVTRYSLHHIQEPRAVLREMYRICRSGGQAMIIDIVAPEDPDTAKRYNQLERLRDPSHKVALAFSTLREMLAEVGFKVVESKVNPHSEMDLEGWFELAQTGADERKQVTEALEREIHTGSESGFHPTYRDGRLKIVHTVGTFLAAKK